MKLTAILIVICATHISASVLGQRIVFKANNISMPLLFKEITKKTGYTFAYNPKDLTSLPKINIEINEATIEEVLDKCLVSKGLKYIILDKTVVIKRNADEVKPAENNLIIVSGRIVDDENKPLPGVTIRQKGTKNVGVSDVQGTFKFFIMENNPVFIFSFIGYATQEIQIKEGDSPLLIKMKKLNSELDQVQVIAYGQTSKRLNPGNVISITAKDIEHNPVSNVLEAIQGRVPGLFIQQYSGVVGGRFDIGIRNSTNFGGVSKRYDGNNPQPLIVLDGVSLPAGTLPGLLNGAGGSGLSFEGGSMLNYINPSEIESIEVLKDADATAIYGSRGAYGVILITTKTAKAGKPTLNVNVYSGVSVDGTGPKLLNTDQYLAMRRESFKNSDDTPGANDNDLNGQYALDKYTDWRKFFIGNAATNTKADASYSGGSELVNYRVNAGYHNQHNIIRGKGGARDGEVGVSLNTKTANNKLTFGIQANYLSSVNDLLSYNLGSNLIFAPNAPDLYLPDGSVNWGAYGDGNAAALLNTIYKNNVTNLSASTNLAYKVFDGFTLRATAAYNDQNSSEISATPSTALPPTAAYAQKTASIFSHYNLRNITVTPIAEYSKDLSKGHLDVKLGGEINDRLATSDRISGTNFSSDALIYDPSAGSNPTTALYNVIPFRTIGFFAVVKYVWKDKYIIDLNGRRDGSTRFGPDRRFGNFGSIAAAWIFSEEKWFKDALPFISFGKLRGSTGVVGGDAIQDFAWVNTYLSQSNAYAGKLGVYNISLANASLEWEKNHRSELGFEIGLFSDRILLAGDYYYNKSSNQLLTQPLPSTTGFKQYGVNSDAIIRNTGWEATLSTKNVLSKNFRWTTRMNITFPKTKLLSLPNYPTGTLNNFKLGESTNGILLYNYAGVNPETGNYQFINNAGEKADYNFFGPGSLNSTTDKTQFIDLNPKFYGGIGNTISYKQISLDFFFTVTKRKGLSFLGQQSNYPGAGTYNIPLSEYEQRWQKPGDIAKVPALGTGFVSVLSQNSFANSTGAYEDATYARLQNVSLNYTLPQSIAKKLGSKSVNCFLQGQNLFTISKYGNLDPETLSASALPPLRIFTGGFNITF